MAKGNLSLTPDEIKAEVPGDGEVPLVAGLIYRGYRVPQGNMGSYYIMGNKMGATKVRYEIDCDVDVASSETVNVDFNRQHNTHAADIGSPTWQEWSTIKPHHDQMVEFDNNGVSGVFACMTTLKATKTDNSDTATIYAMEFAQYSGSSDTVTLHEHDTDKVYTPDYPVSSYHARYLVSKTLNALLAEVYPQICIPLIGDERDTPV